jgi:hypothetical protein
MDRRRSAEGNEYSGGSGVRSLAIFPEPKRETALLV